METLIVICTVGSATAWLRRRQTGASRTDRSPRCRNRRRNSVWQGKRRCEGETRGRRMKTRLKSREFRLRFSRNREPGKGSAVWPGFSPLYDEAHGLQDAGTVAVLPNTSSTSLAASGSYSASFE